MRINSFELMAFCLYSALTVSGDRGIDILGPTDPDKCNPTTKYVIDRNLSVKPSPYHAGDFQKWAKKNGLMLLQESYIFINPAKAPEAPESVLRGLDTAANAYARSREPNVYFVKEDEGYSTMPSQSYGKKGGKGGKKKTGGKKAETVPPQGEATGKPEEEAGETANEEDKQKASKEGEENAPEQDKPKAPENEEENAPEQDKGAGGEDGKKDSSKPADAGFFSGDSFLRGSGRRMSFLKHNM